MPSALPPTCTIVDWVVFGPGYWRRALYTPADCRRMVENFTRLRGYIEPVLKLGHDNEQHLTKRLRKSLGFLNLGDFVRVVFLPDGRVSVTLVNVPTAVGAEINAGRIRSGSVELVPWVADPKDPSKRVQGPVLTGLALLGEEHPAVKGVVPPPRAVFADGTPVPASTDPGPWLEAMTDVVRSAATYSDPTFQLNGIDYPLTTIAFSEMEPLPMLDEAFLKSIGLSPEQIAEVMGRMAGPGDAAAAGNSETPAPGAPGITPAVPPPPKKGGQQDMAHDDQTMMSAAAFSDLVKRLGALEAQRSDAAREASFSAAAERVDRVLKDNATRVPPNTRADERQLGLNALMQKTYGAVSGDADAAFTAWKGRIESMPENRLFASEVNDAAPTKRPLSQPLLDIVRPNGALDRLAPEVSRRLRTPA